ncbi:MAG: uroporphyrinogen-III synthase, partial [Propionibacteriaceae bacterium]
MTPADTSPGTRVDQLRGFRVGVTSDRRSEDLIAALQRRGAQVLHAPALRITANDHDHDEELVAETRAVIAARPDVVLITTGYGMRRWLEVADAAGLGAALTVVLEDARVLARGPKSLGAVRAAGLDDADMSDSETTSSLVDRIIALGAAGLRVAVQQHGYTDEVQLERLRQQGASVLTVTPYRWVSPSSTERLAKLIEAVCQRELDALTFTSAPAVNAVLDTARQLGWFDDFCEAVRSDVLAAVVGPVTGAPLREVGVEPVQPERFRMGALIRLVCDQLEQHRVLRFRSGDVRIELRGRCVDVDDRSVLLGPHALALFKALATSDAVVSRQELMRCLTDGRDDHALEVALSRLRRSLGVPGLITTVVKRGYRLNVEAV